MNTIVVVMLFLLSPNVWSMCEKQYQPECQKLEIISASKAVEKEGVLIGGEKFREVEYCKVAIKSDQSDELIYAKLENCPTKRYFVGSIHYGCNDTFTTFEFDKIVTRTAKECPNLKRRKSSGK